MGTCGKAAKARWAVRVSLWVMPASTNVLLLTCIVVLLAAAFEEHLPSSVLGEVWSGCLAQALVMVQLPLLLLADSERVAAAVGLPLPPNHKSNIGASINAFQLKRRWRMTDQLGRRRPTRRPE